VTSACGCGNEALRCIKCEDLLASQERLYDGTSYLVGWLVS